YKLCCNDADRLFEDNSFAFGSNTNAFGHNYPEEADGTLDCGGLALTCRFNRWGSLLAVGGNDGRVMIIDFTTRGIVKVLAAHVQPISSLSWSRNGRRLLTSSSDNTVAVWNIVSNECIKRFRFNSLITKVQFHPRNDDMFMVCSLKNAVVSLRLSDQSSFAITCEEDSGGEQNLIASFNRRGDYLIIGNGRGKITIHDVINEFKQVGMFRLQSNHAVRSIEFSRRGGDYFLTNSNDRIIRVFDFNEVLRTSVKEIAEPVQKLQDLVNKTPWKVCCFSGDMEHICAGSARTNALYVWDINTGSLVKILHGVKGEVVSDVAWHPIRALLCSISNGSVTVWSQTHVENWSAFAPDFKELDENVEYEERESEFDLNDEDKSVELDSEKPDQDIEVDVVNIDRSSAFCSSDEESEPPDSLWYLPSAPDVEDPEEPLSAGSFVAPDQTSLNVCSDFVVSNNIVELRTTPSSRRLRKNEYPLPVNGPGGKIDFGKRMTMIKND
uniref:Anaphase-promoting complex subunit 4-like WD40 domain-containing protein n=1 Tax=Romanomermis culicivorax TaxID=13658 RepID=A0A915L636_ROMCU